LFAQDFQLFHSGFSSPITWTLSPLAYVTNSAAVFATSPPSANRDFFRLKK
jgi:hypothetical protein